MGLIKMKNKLTLKFILGDLKHFYTISFVVFPSRVLAGWVRTLNGKFIKFFFFFKPSLNVILRLLKAVYFVVVVVNVVPVPLLVVTGHIILCVRIKMDQDNHKE